MVYGIKVAGLLIVVLAFILLFKSTLLRFIKKSKILNHHLPFQNFLIRTIKTFSWSFYSLAVFYLLINVILPELPYKKTLNLIFIGLITIQLIYIGQVFSDFLLDLIADNQKKDNPQIQNTINFAKLIATIVIWAAGILLLLSNLGYNITSIITGLGIGGIAIALAVQNILGDILNSFSIIFDKPFIIGDTITVGVDSGTVEYIGIKTTRLRAIHGEQLIIPNTDLVKSRIQNFKHMHRRRMEFTLGLTYDTSVANIMKATELIKNLILANSSLTLDRVHFASLGEYSQNIEVVLFVESPDYLFFMDQKEKLLLSIKEAFEKAQIEFAFPTHTILTEKAQ